MVMNSPGERSLVRWRRMQRKFCKCMACGAHLLENEQLLRSSFMPESSRTNQGAAQLQYEIIEPSLARRNRDDMSGSEPDYTQRFSTPTCRQHGICFAELIWAGRVHHPCLCLTYRTIVGATWISETCGPVSPAQPVAAHMIPEHI